MKRRIKNTLVIVSLLLFLGSIALAVRSYSVGDSIGGFVRDIDVETWQFHIASARGLVEIEYFNAYFAQTPPALPTQWRYTRMDPRITQFSSGYLRDGFVLHLSDFQLRCRDTTPGFAHFYAVLPLWWLLPTVIPGFIVWRRWRRTGTRGFPLDDRRSAPAHGDA